jgi:hypothetical protein
MHIKSLALAAALAAAAVAGANANTLTLLTLMNPPGQSDTPYSFSFEAGGAFPIYLTVQGYQVPAFEQVTNNVVSDSLGDSQLLGQNWTFYPAQFGSDTDQYDDGGGTGANGLNFGAVTPPYVDSYQQVFNSTVSGEIFTYSFDFSNDSASEPSYLRVSVGTTSAIPEASTWAMMVLGFVGLGFAARRGRKAVVAIA